jgi:hypothetical protein
MHGQEKITGIPAIRILKAGVLRRLITFTLRTLMDYIPILPTP